MFPVFKGHCNSSLRIKIAQSIIVKQSFTLILTGNKRVKMFAFIFSNYKMKYFWFWYQGHLHESVENTVSLPLWVSILMPKLLQLARQVDKGLRSIQDAHSFKFGTECPLSIFQY